MIRKVRALRVLGGLKPERVFYYFEEISKIPHGSYNVKAVSDYCMGVAKSLGLEVRQDEAYNVIIKKPASEGYGPSPAVMIQGHMDMVCVHDAEYPIDMEKEAISLIVEDGFVRADHTTLGGDDGIAVAMGLAILEDDSLEHPDLEVVFTTEEEVGMDGAIALDVSDLKSAYLLNLDSEKEGVFLAGCAGGCKAAAEFSFLPEEVSGEIISLSISGLVGGHSGDEIDKCRASAIMLLGRVLGEMEKTASFRIVKMSGGEKDNAIPVDSCAQIVAVPEDAEVLLQAVDQIASKIKGEFRTADPGICISAKREGQSAVQAFDPVFTENMIFMLLEVPNGIQTMSADLPGLVESSLNLGILRTEEEKVTMTWAIRSSVPSLKELICDKLERLTLSLEGDISWHGDYPAWTFNPDSRICRLCTDVYKEQTGEEAVIATIHAGLECGLLSEKMPEMDMVSMGPNIYDIHTAREHMDIASVERSCRLVCEVLRRIRTLG